MAFSGLGAAVPLSSRPEVVFLSPDDSPFWHMVSGFMTEVAADLHLDLEVLLDRNAHRYSYLQTADDVLSREHKPDYLVFMCKEQVTTRMLRYANEMGVKVFTFNTGIPASTRASVGLPRETLPNWIGHVMSDDSGAGSDLAILLEQQSLRLGLIEPGQPVPLIALSGTLDSSAAKDRQQGLMNTVDADRSKLLQLVDAEWDRQLAAVKTLVLLKRHPQATAIWSASDGMALGAVKAARQSGRKPGRDVVIGGFDWEAEALDAIRSGDLAVSFGRHFMGGGLTLLLLHDYHFGADFLDGRSSPVLSYKLKPANINNVDIVEKIMGREQWRNVDFSRFSRAPGSGKPESQPSADELINEFTKALIEAYAISASRLLLGPGVSSAPDSGKR
ncbi:ABC transporter substrate-binding protein [Marinobacter sp. F3R11]|uniref:ABC transporter substrate-binding protein n=1 Tax=Marinobacter sp. F3R11 TaxID=2267231 RepID=UPI0011E5B3BB|nr:ABC transporter substrate-binding protein [Marinobacter sp. F3R11]